MTRLWPPHHNQTITFIRYTELHMEGVKKEENMLISVLLHHTVRRMISSEDLVTRSLPVSALSSPLRSLDHALVLTHLCIHSTHASPCDRASHHRYTSRDSGRDVLGTYRATTRIYSLVHWCTGPGSPVHQWSARTTSPSFARGSGEINITDLDTPPWLQ